MFGGRTIYKQAPLNETPDIAIGILLPMNKSADSYNEKLTALSGSGAPSAGGVGQSYSGGSRGGASVFQQSYTTEEQAISNLKNLLLTFKGERIMQPEFGTLIRKSVFEQNTLGFVDSLKESLLEDIERWLPYIIVSDIIINQNVDVYSISLSVIFKVTESGANLVIEIFADENQIIITDLQPAADVNFALTKVGEFGY